MPTETSNMSQYLFEVVKEGGLIGALFVAVQSNYLLGIAGDDGIKKCQSRLETLDYTALQHVDGRWCER